MGYRVFDLSERAHWYPYVERLVQKDIYFTPEYCEIYERNGDGKAHVFIYEEGDAFVYYPFLKRKITDIPHLEKLESEYGELYDMTTPYGYGGPLTNVIDHEERRQLFASFQTALKEYCFNTNIITEFVRFHPLIENEAIYPIEKQYLHDTVYVDLRLKLDDIWANYDTKNRNRIRKARTHGLEVIHRPVTELDDLIRLYEQTMEKNDAREYYYFNKQFFDDTAQLLEGNLTLIEVRLDEKVIISCLFMSYGDFAHYHLLGSDKDYLHYAPNNLLIHHAVQWAKLSGKNYLHLGGGSAGKDALYRFKKRFNKYGDKQFFVGKVVHNEAIYDALTKGVEFAHDDYFPAYRHPDFYKEKQLMNSSGHLVSE